jgi:hypothetical protein
MAQWHLDELRGALERKGWRVVAEHPGDDYKVSGTWELHRSRDSRVVLIDFEGLDDLHALPIDESYACSMRGSKHSLYFRRRGESGSSARARWRGELQSFVEAVGAQVAV